MLDAGALEFAGQAIDLTQFMPLTSASLEFAGQTIFLETPTFLVLDHASLELNGQAIDLLALNPTTARKRFFIAPTASRMGGMWRGRS